MNGTIWLYRNLQDIEIWERRTHNTTLSPTVTVIGPTCEINSIKTVVVIISIKTCNVIWSVRPLRLSGSCGTTRFRSACLPTATVVYFTPSDVRTRSLVVRRVVVRVLPWRPRHVIRMLDRFISRRLGLQVAPSCLARSWMLSRRWSLSSPCTWPLGASLLSAIYYFFLG